MRISDLKHGMILDSSDLLEVFGCSPQGGMCRSYKTNTLVLISDQTKLYHDRWADDVFLYTGMGQRGDQNFFYSQNKTLYESRANGVEVHFFEVTHPKQYTYQGIFELAGTPYMEKQTDQDDESRQVCIFPIKRK